jgi:hypothetical protein
MFEPVNVAAELLDEVLVLIGRQDHQHIAENRRGDSINTWQKRSTAPSWAANHPSTSRH